jgi:hypothetical protein
MKAVIGAWVALAICLFAFVGCKRSGSGAPPKTDFDGVKVDWPKLDTEFASSDPEVQNGAYMAKKHIRYNRFIDALLELDKLSTDPRLTEAQKKVVADLIEQTKEAIAKAPQPAGQ